MVTVHSQTEQLRQETSSLYVSGLYWLTWITLTHWTGEDSCLIELLSVFQPPNIVLNLYPSSLPETIFIIYADESFFLTWIQLHLTTVKNIIVQIFND